MGADIQAPAAGRHTLSDAPGAHPVTHENREGRISNRAAGRMPSGWILAETMASAPRNPLPSEDFYMLHAICYMLRTKNLVSAVFEAGP